MGIGSITGIRLAMKYSNKEESLHPASKGKKKGERRYILRTSNSKVSHRIIEVTQQRRLIESTDGSQ